MYGLQHGDLAKTWIKQMPGVCTLLSVLKIEAT